MLSIFLLAAFAPQSEPQILSDSTRTLATVGVTIRDQRTLDAATGRVTRRTTNAATGSVIDADQLLRDDARAFDRVHAKISAELQPRLLDPEAELEVVFWLRAPAGAT